MVDHILLDTEVVIKDWALDRLKSFPGPSLNNFLEISLRGLQLMTTSFQHRSFCEIPVFELYLQPFGETICGFGGGCLSILMTHTSLSRLPGNAVALWWQGMTMTKSEQVETEYWQHTGDPGKERRGLWGHFCLPHLIWFNWPSQTWLYQTQYYCWETSEFSNKNYFPPP